MTLEPKLAENMIVGEIFRSNWTWYVSPPWLWILDLERYDEAQGFSNHNAKLGTISYERPVIIVNESTAPSFHIYMREYQVNADYLSKFVLERISREALRSATREEGIQIYEAVLELFPSLVVNFDQRALYSAYAEPMHISFTTHIPSGWEGHDDNVLTHVPEQHRYWVIDGFDYFAELLEIVI